MYNLKMVQFIFDEHQFYFDMNQIERIRNRYPGLNYTLFYNNTYLNLFHKPLINWMSIDLATM